MDPLNLILLIMVVLIGWRLRSVLGTRNDDEKPSSRADAYRLNRDAYENPPASRQDNAREVIKAADATENSEAEKATSTDSGTDTGTDMAAADAPEQGEIATDDAPQMGRGLAYLRGIDPDFDEGGFLDGAGRAYEMILSAFAAGDLSDVRGFLGDDVASGLMPQLVNAKPPVKNWRRGFCASTDRRLKMLRLMARWCVWMCAFAPKLCPLFMPLIRCWMRIICLPRRRRLMSGALRARMAQPMPAGRWLPRAPADRPTGLSQA